LSTGWNASAAATSRSPRSVISPLASSSEAAPTCETAVTAREIRAMLTLTDVRPDASVIIGTTEIVYSWPPRASRSIHTRRLAPLVILWSRMRSERAQWCSDRRSQGAFRCAGGACTGTSTVRGRAFLDRCGRVCYARTPHRRQPSRMRPAVPGQRALRRDALPVGERSLPAPCQRRQAM
jgi:hypothetical protein